LRLCRRIDHVETRSPPYVFPIVARVIEIQPCLDEAEEQASLDAYNAVWPQAAVTLDDVHSFKSSMRENVDYLARIDGTIAASAVAAIRPQRTDRVFTLVTVLAEHRRRGVGSALYDAVSRWAADRRVDALETWVEEDDPQSLGYAQRRGFEEIERNGRMVLELASVDRIDVHPPPGIEIVSWAERPELARGLYEVACETWPDIPGSEEERMEPFEDWLAHDMQGSGDRPEATFVAVAGEEVAGYAKFSLTAARPKVASHDLTGVRRAWRGRGIAGALKRAQIVWAKEQGFERLETTNEMRNEPIRRLNSRLGYRPAPGRIFLLGPLAG
jgi:mycothiol synthase